MKRLLGILIFITITILSIACGHPEPLTKTAVVMDTVVTLEAEDGEREQAVEEGMAYLQRIDALASQNEGSDLEALRHAAGTGQWVEISPEVFEMLEISQEWAAKTDGAFDVTVGPVVWLWGI
ncbi:FAD:protein FMN transferase, partial [Selenomonas sp.]|uniref:FAD:protein FMN transferase n=1 Tax=Selenomonas sp. TaxID=2053611 RepID=UPI002A763811